MAKLLRVRCFVLFDIEIYKNIDCVLNSFGISPVSNFFLFFVLSSSDPNCDLGKFVWKNCITEREEGGRL